MTDTAGTAPPLTVTVIMFTSVASLRRCLDALHQQRGVDTPQIIVPCDDTLTEADALEAAYPEVRFIRIDGRRTPAQLRATAVAAADGVVVGLLEDHCAPDTDWCARILEAHSQPRAAVGGAVEKGFPPGRATDSMLNWAVYMTDYSRYMNPMPAGPTHSLTDCNVSYRRSSLEPITALWQSEFHENIVNEALHERGEVLWFEPAVVVREQRTLTLMSATRDRYTFGRLFASTRVEGTPLVRRLVWAAASVLMPPVLALRAARNLLSRRRHRGQILRCAPALLYVAAAWMTGELVGYLTASPGTLRPASPGNGAAGAATGSAL